MMVFLFPLYYSSSRRSSSHSCSCCKTSADADVESVVVTAAVAGRNWAGHSWVQPLASWSASPASLAGLVYAIDSAHVVRRLMKCSGRQ